MALASGTRLGPYEIVSPLGAGGMGEVYAARDTRLDRRVAIKVLAAELAAHGSAHLARFQREAKAASALNNPNIVTVYDVGETDGTSWVAGLCRRARSSIGAARSRTVWRRRTRRASSTAT